MPSLKEFQSMSAEGRRDLLDQHYAKTPPDDDQDEDEHCREYGNTPETGACFYCKMD